MLLSTLRILLEAERNGEFAIWQQNYMRNQFPFLGVKIPLVRKAVKQLQSNNWRADAKRLFTQPEREFHHAAIFLAVAHRKTATADDLHLYKEFLQTYSWWDTVDTIAPHLVGPLLHRFPPLIAHVEKWLDSPHLWLRRAALIYPLHNRKNMDQARLFRSCAHLRHDSDFFIRKAIGWVLREHSKTHGVDVAQFLHNTQFSPLSVRQAKKYLEYCSPFS